jgi:tetratricopeptide (TPR) repeat protein
MSYINDALKKAQQEKDSLYGHYGSIISRLPGPRTHARIKWFVVACSATLMLVSLFVWMMIASYHERPVSAKEEQPVKAGGIAEPVKTSISATAATVESSAVVSTPATTVESAAPATQTGVIKPLSPDAGALYEEALAAQQNKKFTVAESLYRRVLTIDAQHVQAMNNLGVLYMAQKKHAQAIALFSKAISVNKDYADPYYNLACIYAQHNKKTSSIEYLNLAITIDGAVVNWAKTDVDLKNIRDSKAFKKLMEKKGK